MPLRALRPNRSERDLRRRSTIDPIHLFKRDPPPVPDLPTAAAAVASPHRIAVSEDGRRPSSPDLNNDDDDDAGADHGLSPPRPRPSPSLASRRFSFSLMRFRHASDPQLSAKAKEHAERHGHGHGHGHGADDDVPPVPAIPPASTAAAPAADRKHPSCRHPLAAC